MRKSNANRDRYEEELIDRLIIKLERSNRGRSEETTLDAGSPSGLVCNTPEQIRVVNFGTFEESTLTPRKFPVQADFSPSPKARSKFSLERGCELDTYRVLDDDSVKETLMASTTQK